MGRKKNGPAGQVQNGLRHRAEELLAQQGGELEEFSGRDLEEIVHELGTYKVELELQNEDLKSTQLELDQSRSRYVDLYDHAPVGYFTFAPDGKILAANLTGAYMLEAARNDLRRMHFSFFLVPENANTFYRYLRKIVREDGRHVAEVEMRSKGGRRFHARLESLGVKDDTGRTVEIRTILTDITELKNKQEEITSLNQELLRSNEDLLHFAFIVSHDLQEPLRTISSFVQLLKRRYDHLFDDKGHVFMQHIIAGTEHMKQLLNDLLTFSRVGSGTLSRETVSLHDVLETVELNLADPIKESGAEITSGDLPEIKGDSALFSTLLQNLISNSLKYRGYKQPKIHLSAEKIKDEWRFCVQDNGIGLEQQYAEQIFLIFQRLHKRDEYEGTGIGLAICKRIVERHGGRIWVESAPGKGALFCFSLPDEERRQYA